MCDLESGRISSDECVYHNDSKPCPEKSKVLNHDVTDLSVKKKN